MLMGGCIRCRQRVTLTFLVMIRRQMSPQRRILVVKITDKFRRMSFMFGLLKRVQEVFGECSWR